MTYFKYLWGYRKEYDVGLNAFHVCWLANSLVGIWLYSLVNTANKTTCTVDSNRIKIGVNFSRDYYKKEFPRMNFQMHKQIQEEQWNMLISLSVSAVKLD